MNRRAPLGVLLGVSGVLGLLAACGTPHADVHANRTHQVQSRETYVALGDSYTSAPEIGDPTGPAGCSQTSLNYPHLIAAKLDLHLVDASCGGATTDDLKGRQHTPDGAVPPQLDALTSDTSLVTLSIGANDENVFGNLLQTCGRLALSDPNGSPCTDSVGSDGPAKLDRYQSRLTDRLVRAVGAIAKRAPKARVLLIGYPQLVPTSAGSCHELALAAGDFPYAHQVNLLLNDAVRAAADRSQAEYVDLWAATKGHDICSSDPWMAGFRPIHPAAPYHPYAKEQQVVASLVEKALQKK